MATYYCGDICLVNNVWSGGNFLHLTKLRQDARKPLRRALRMLAPQIDDLLGDSELEVLPGHIDHLGRVFAVPPVLDGTPDLARVATDCRARRLELLDLLSGRGRVPARNVPYVGVPRGQSQCALPRRSDPDRWVRLLDRFGLCDRVREPVVPALEARPVLREQRLDDL